MLHVSRMGKTLFSALSSAGLSHYDGAYLSVVGCHPNDEGTPRPAAPTEVAACRSNLLDALDAANVRYVMLSGVAATRSWRADLPLADVAGRLFVWRDRWLVMPTFSLQGVMTGAQDGVQWRDHVRQFSYIVNEDVGLDALSRACIECGDGLYAYDDDGVPYCRAHFNLKGSAKTDKKWTDKNARQGRLL